MILGNVLFEYMSSLLFKPSVFRILSAIPNCDDFNIIAVYFIEYEVIILY